MAGALVLVVGPSGAGKDTLIRAARERLAAYPRFIFVRRMVTRDADPEAEDHETISRAEFERGRAVGDYALCWEAHGLGYALPYAVTDAVREGHVAVANVSRRVIAEAKDRFPGCRVLLVDAAAEVRANRLAGRGRETGAEIAARLAREGNEAIPADAICIDNSGGLEDSVVRFVAALEAIAAK
jgi:phosphonate metabolism protein PhnN/1,5-bisphosphokinase (PRPP-forming)